MQAPDTLDGRYAVAVGVVLALVGVWGLFDQLILGLLAMNALHGVVHVVFGVAGLAAGLGGYGREFSGALGVVLLVEGVLGLVPATRGVLEGLFNVNDVTVGVQLALAVASLAVYYVTRRAAAD